MPRAVIWALILLCTVAAVTLWRATARLEAAMKAHPPEGRFIEVSAFDDHPVHVVELGEASAPPVVLIHGASGNTRDMTFDIAGALAADYRVLVFDRPGLGYTPALAPSDVTISDQAALLQAAATQLGAPRPVVMGQSFGGAIGLAWAVEHPDNIAALVNVAGAAYPWQGRIDPFYRALQTPVLGHVMAWLIAGWVPLDYVRGEIEGVFTPNEMPEGYADYIAPRLIIDPSRQIPNAQQRVSLREELRALAPRYPDIRIPVEILHGAADMTVGLSIHSAPLAEAVPTATLTTLPGIGHMPHHAARDDVIAAIHRASRRAGLRPGE